MQTVKLFLMLAFATCLVSCKGQVEVERKKPMNAQVVKYKDMNSGYRDPDGSRMESFLQCWKAQTLRWAEANNMQKAVEDAQGRYQGDGAEQLPPSVVNFWRVAKRIDWLSIYDVREGRRFLEPLEIKYIKDVMPMDYEILKDTRSVAAPDRYYVYNSSQWSVSASDIDDYVVYGDEEGGVFYGEIRNEKSIDSERQFIFYAPHGPAIRFKSFAHLLANFYLEEYQLANGLDTSLGHIYYFNGDWNKTCVPLLFDADEIASWQVSR